MQDGAVLTDKIVEQILEISKSGEINMFDARGVQRLANDRGFYELVIFIEEDVKAYSNFIFTGKRN